MDWLLIFVQVVLVLVVSLDTEATVVHFNVFRLYHVWGHLLKSYLQQPISTVKETFKKGPPLSRSNYIELPSNIYALMHPGFPNVKKCENFYCLITSAANYYIIY